MLLFGFAFFLDLMLSWFSINIKMQLIGFLLLPLKCTYFSINELSYMMDILFIKLLQTLTTEDEFAFFMNCFQQNIIKVKSCLNCS